MPQVVVDYYGDILYKIYKEFLFFFGGSDHAEEGGIELGFKSILIVIENIFLSEE
jgi:hypothetical protein